MQQGQNIPVVQGYVVDNNEGKTNNINSYQDSQGHSFPSGYVEPQVVHRHYQQEASFNGVQGEKQPNQFQDVIWAIAFVLHLVIMVVVMLTMGSSYYNEGHDYSGMVGLISVCGLVGFGLSSFALGFMMKFANEMVKIALVFSVGCSLVAGILGAMTGQMWMCILWFLSFGIGLCYAYLVWSRIPVSDTGSMHAAARLFMCNSGINSSIHSTIIINFYSLLLVRMPATKQSLPLQASLGWLVKSSSLCTL